MPSRFASEKSTGRERDCDLIYHGSKSVVLLVLKRVLFSDSLSVLLLQLYLQKRSYLYFYRTEVDRNRSHGDAANSIYAHDLFIYIFRRWTVSIACSSTMSTGSQNTPSSSFGKSPKSRTSIGYKGMITAQNTWTGLLWWGLINLVRLLASTSVSSIPILNNSSNLSQLYFQSRTCICNEPGQLR